MKFAMTKMAASIAVLGFSAFANAAGGIGTITEINITGGDFGMGAPSSPATCSSDPADFANQKCISAGTANPIDADDGVFEGPTLTAFNFFGNPVTTFTAATATGASPSTSGNPLEGTTTASTITLDLGSFYANWNGTNFLQAPNASTGALNPLVTGTYDSTTGAFDVSWSSYITTAPFQTQTGYWHLTGNVTAVPEASTYGMMLAGLGLVGGLVARRRKLMA